MIYIDSDGVISDFNGWVKSKGIDIESNRSIIDKLIISNYKDVFIGAKECNNSSIFLNEVKNNKNCYILTAAPKLSKFKKNFPEEYNLTEKINIMKENKYKWYEQRGIPRYKVIIVESHYDKLKYCNNKEDILIDDYKETIDMWNNNGGTGILSTDINKIQEIFNF